MPPKTVGWDNFGVLLLPHSCRTYRCNVNDRLCADRGTHHTQSICHELGRAEANMQGILGQLALFCVGQMRALLSLPTFPNGVELRPRGQWRYVAFAWAPRLVHIWVVAYGSAVSGEIYDTSGRYEILEVVISL